MSKNNKKYERCNKKNEAIYFLPVFYQIYEGAAYLAGAKPYFLNTIEDNHYLPDFENVPIDVWQRCQLLYLCSQGNPTGAVVNKTTLQNLIKLAQKYDFIIASDECYSEIYFDELSSKSFLGVDWKLPKDPETFLDITYGPSWANINTMPTKCTFIGWIFKTYLSFIANSGGRRIKKVFRAHIHAIPTIYAENIIFYYYFHKTT